ncbi:MAG: 50S ribosomal protein L21 [Omnitrophica bacterium RIFCSPLOWO2_12_FULL_44_17]|uniref:Large ribosomal subunit protein bL21 n=1 Tax=Candidatus Danuiimicrobium aquiferis TaxID=1801832 RepID=A0A1G1KS27_9BACT|nr:MAG: 50S ribosomal protein L21 [Omnitrophica bacterium RIFCSPHIGHO2_02_FULL_45_28]OGW91224.1 MAG: 50S ribosomal protein L21 [Omnitrophica bacterium RIFCSPHIGHO2_12_FULL_44_12]OGW95625.1 MAG: 50S ribosomal protein L21 [Omnitrophica bacterium RIFCSPLOWO2_12_FULL_44_17]OGX03662.1 MAG: 50S ribosomal protein L21 [Omnitrophica bacterium RIFCSPLOWO2_02_FULL_44_11]
MSKYVIVSSGGRQYTLEENTVVKVEKLDLAGAKEVKLDQILAYKDGDNVFFGQPHLTNVEVLCDVLGEEKQKKVINFKFKRRKGYKRKKGHRQVLLKLKVKSIQLKEV